MANIWENNGNSDRLYFGGGWGPKSLQMVTAAMKLRHLLLGRKVMTKLNRILKSREKKNKEIKSRDITLPAKVHLVKVMVFPVVVYG